MENANSQKLKETEKFLQIENSYDLAKQKLIITPKVKQFWTALLPLFSLYICGLSMGYSAVLLPQLEANETTIKVTKSDSSWIASMTAISMIPGALLGIYCMDKIGRKKSLLLHCLPSFCGWISIFLATNVIALFIGRFLTGLSVGMCGPPAPILIGETSQPKYRGMFLAGISSALTFGILVIHVLGTFLTWQTSALVCSLFPFIIFIFLLTIPETPPWLMGQNRFEEAEKSLRWLRGDKYSNEYLVLKTKHEQSDKISTSVWESLRKREFLKPLFIVFGFFLMMQLSGIYVVTFYTVSIMAGIFDGGIDAYFSMIIVDATRVVMSVVGCILARKFKRKTMTLITGIGTAVSIFAFSTFSYLSKQIPEVFGGYSWITLVFLITYICFVQSGIYGLPFILKGEYFSLATRGIGSGATSLFNSIGLFFIVKSANGLFEFLTLEGTFVFYGSSVLIGSIMLYFVMIESKNKTLMEIEEEFKK